MEVRGTFWRPPVRPFAELPAAGLRALSRSRRIRL